ncbi:hypothetical protein PHLH8_05910 [Pseudomonas sp. Pc102]|nr:hypothetical protein PHLH8_05910 [Pseudomonas sp. Pc102]
MKRGPPYALARITFARMRNQKPYLSSRRYGKLTWNLPQSRVYRSPNLCRAAYRQIISIAKVAPARAVTSALS